MGNLIIKMFSNNTKNCETCTAKANLESSYEIINTAMVRQHRDELKKKNIEIFNLQLDLENALICNKALEIRLYKHKMINSDFERYFPSWLYRFDLTRSQIWTITMSFNISPKTFLMREKLLNFLTFEQIGRIIENLYDEFSESHESRRSTGPVKNEADWEKIFCYMEMYTEEEKRVIKALFEDYQIQDIDEAKKKILENSFTLILLKNVNPEALNQKILNCFSSKQINILHIQRLHDKFNPRKKSSSIVLSINNDDRQQFKDILPEVSEELKDVDKVVEIEIIRFSTDRH